VRKNAVIGAVLLLGVILILAFRRAEVEEVARTLASGRTLWILAAVVLQGVFFTLYAGLYQTAFFAVEVRSRVRDLLPVWFAAIFLNTVTPTVGPALFIEDAVRRGESGARAAAGLILVRVADNLTFLLILLAGFVELAIHHSVRPFEFFAGFVFVGILLGWSAVLLLGLWRPIALQYFLGRVQQIVATFFRWFKRPAPLAADWAAHQTGEFANAARLLAQHPRRLLMPVGIAVLAHVVDIASLLVVFGAYRQPVSIGVLIAGFSVGVLFWIVSITPEGVGVVEGMMALTFVSLGIPMARAAAVTLAFRGLTYYLPLLVGALFVQRLPLLHSLPLLRKPLPEGKTIA
jgi:uncharacterized protein (TIRG00374 family)